MKTSSLKEGNRVSSVKNAHTINSSHNSSLPAVPNKHKCAVVEVQEDSNGLALLQIRPNTRWRLV